MRVVCIVYCKLVETFGWWGEMGVSLKALMAGMERCISCMMKRHSKYDVVEISRYGNYEQIFLSVNDRTINL